MDKSSLLAGLIFWSIVFLAVIGVVAWRAWQDSKSKKEALRGALAYAIKEADGWHDECRGGPIETPEMSQARALLTSPSLSRGRCQESIRGK